LKIILGAGDGEGSEGKLSRSDRADQSGGPLRGEIGGEKGIRLAEDGAGGEVAAADGAFHGGGPAGLSVIAGEEQAANAVGRRRLCGAETVDSRGRGKGGAFFDDDGAAEELGVAGGGESPANLLGEKIE